VVPDFIYRYGLANFSIFFLLFEGIFYLYISIHWFRIKIYRVQAIFDLVMSYSLFLYFFALGGFNCVYPTITM
jgi:hypothetical protein